MGREELALGFLERQEIQAAIAAFNISG